ncbi:hypothetical protein T439DRAFT_382752 [Meredithblackwellia eburnea MCA 4105]
MVTRKEDLEDKALPLPALPAEILLEIISTLIPPSPSSASCKEAASYLTKYALVNKQWKIWAQRLLFRDIFLPNDISSSRLHTAITRDGESRLGSLVRSLRITEAREQQIENGEKVQDLNFLIPLVECCTNLKEIRIIGGNLLQLSQLLSKCPSLESLLISDCPVEISPEWQDLSSSSLCNLYLSEIEFGLELRVEQMSDIFFKSLSTIPTLRSLAVTYIGLNDFVLVPNLNAGAAHDQKPIFAPSFAALLPQLQSLSFTMRDLASDSFTTSSKLEFLDCFGDIITPSKAHRLPPTLRILRLNQFPSVPPDTIPPRLVDGLKSARLPDLEEIWFPSEWKDDKDEYPGLIDWCKKMGVKYEKENWNTQVEEEKMFDQPYHDIAERVVRMATA